MLLGEKKDLHGGESSSSRTPSQPSEQLHQAIRVHLDTQRNDDHHQDTSNVREEMQAPISFEDSVDGMAAVTFSDETESGFFGEVLSLGMHTVSANTIRRSIF